MEVAAIAIFCIALVVCVATGTTTVVALVVGLCAFLAYGALKGFGAAELAKMAVKGVVNARNVIIAMLIIGMLTALWRAAGTIPAIVYYASGAIWPPIFLLATFLLNALLSTLTGTSFGTSATMGAMCMAVGTALGIDPVLAGGAVLSGAFVGDRCSPVSTCALLVATITETDLYNNIKLMLRTAALPFALTCVVYTTLGFLTSGAAAGAAGAVGTAGGGQVAAVELLERNFYLGLPTLLPAVAVLVLALLRVDVKIAMLAGVVTAAFVCVLCQGASVGQTLLWTWSGFTTDDPQLAAMLAGGGIVSMIEVAAIVCISSTYAGLFEGTGLLDGARGLFGGIARRTTGFFSVTCASVVACVIACNQTLAIMLTNQLVGDVVPDPKDRPLFLADTAVVIAALVPWSIAGAVPLVSCGAPLTGMLAACYLYLLPICGNVRHALAARRLGGRADAGEAR